MRTSMLAALSLLLASGTALAQGQPQGQVKPAERQEVGPRGGGGSDLIVGQATAILGLSKDQEQKIRKISIEYRREEIQLDNKIQLLELDLQVALQSEKMPSEAEVLAIATKLANLEAEQIMLRIKSVLKVRKILTPQQWMMLESMRERAAPGKQGR